MRATVAVAKNKKTTKPGARAVVKMTKTCLSLSLCHPSPFENVLCFIFGAL